MRNLKINILAILVMVVSFTYAQDGHGHNQSKMKKNEKMDMNKDAKAEVILSEYFNLKNELVVDNAKKSAVIGFKLVTLLKAFNISKYTKAEQKELSEIIEDATEHAEHIAKSAIDHQREHFKILSIDIIDMIAITGTKNTLYQQFCPMYDKGSAWLSTSNVVKNPYYGSKMLTCGKIHKEIN